MPRPNPLADNTRSAATTGFAADLSPNRRTFLADLGMGFTGLALGSLLHRDNLASASESKWQPPSGLPHRLPKAKSVIWLFMVGGVSQMESFDVKPAINKYANKSLDETPYANVLDNPLLDQNLRVVDKRKQNWKTLYPLQVNYHQTGDDGILISDDWPHLEQRLNDIALIRGMWTTDDNHGAQLQFHTGRHLLDGMYPSIGSWVHYGLGSLNENLPQFVVMGEPIKSRFGGNGSHGADYLGPQHAGVQIRVDPQNPLPFGRPGRDVSLEEQQREFELLNDLHQLRGVEYPQDPALQARIKSYELAFRMQRSMPEVFQFDQETAATQQLYGLDRPETKPFGQYCLAARRMVERGVRFIQIYDDGPNDAGGKWDTHNNSYDRMKSCALGVDKPIAGLLTDLEQQGLLEETLVCFMTEFGRTPGGQGAKATGREHHPYGFTVWMAGGGIKGGVVHGETDELGFHAISGRHYVTDIHATVLHQLGLDSRRLEIPGRKRLDIDHGEPIHEILA